MKKLVNGEMVNMPAAEATAMQAEWDAAAAKKVADADKPKEPTLEDRLAALETYVELDAAAARK